MGGLEVKLDEDAEVLIIPSIAGGLVNGELSMLPELTREEILRYSRHLLIPEVGLEGQQKLKASSVLIVGTGRPGVAVGIVSGSSRHRADWPGRL